MTWSTLKRSSRRRGKMRILSYLSFDSLSTRIDSQGEVSDVRCLNKTEACSGRQGLRRVSPLRRFGGAMRSAVLTIESDERAFAALFDQNRKGAVIEGRTVNACQRYQAFGITVGSTSKTTGPFGVNPIGLISNSASSGKSISKSCESAKTKSATLATSSAL